MRRGAGSDPLDDATNVEHVMTLLGLITIFALATAAFCAWRRSPVWLTRCFRPVRAAELGFHASGAASQLVEDYGAAVHIGIHSRLQHPKSDWRERCEAVDPKWRPLAYEGAAFACGSLFATVGGRWTRLAKRMVDDSPEQRASILRGLGLWCGFRFDRDFESVLRLAHEYEPWWRYHVLDGYGFRFGFFGFLSDRRSVAHLYALPTLYRRVAFRGVGRALYFAFLSDRKGLIETVSDFAPQHDLDVIEGAAYSAAFVECGQLQRAVDFARAMPHEWRPNIHLGIVQGLRRRADADPVYLEKCLARLPAKTRSAFLKLIDVSRDIEHAVQREFGPRGYMLWSQRLTRHIEHERLWEPVYADAAQRARSDGEGAIR